MVPIELDHGRPPLDTVLVEIVGWTQDRTAPKSRRENASGRRMNGPRIETIPTPSSTESRDDSGGGGGAACGEARSAAAIHHPNATRICSFGEQAGSDHAAEEIQAENGVLGLRRTEFRWQTSAR